ncbi:MULTISPECIES: hypothetical protein [Bradyrhizobium]|nr:hypothetical protein [Bradyrhizobium elkanii]
MTYTDLLLCFVFILLIYLLLEVKELRNQIRYYLARPDDGDPPK